jgi:hypothetical protein
VSPSCIGSASGWLARQLCCQELLQLLTAAVFLLMAELLWRSTYIAREAIAQRCKLHKTLNFSGDAVQHNPTLCAVCRSRQGTLDTGGLLWWQELAQRWLGGPGVSCHVCPCDLYLLRSQTPASRVSQMATICLRTSGHDSTLQAVHNASHCVVQELAHIASWLVKSSCTCR